ncbi:MAG: hypothetical protein IPK81_06105 [Rhodospirillales bacterium]|nr:MAG: hypothetical protein IPK81_06105 [Rhodospirillales bacterium]
MSSTDSSSTAVARGTRPVVRQNRIFGPSTDTLISIGLAALLLSFGIYLAALYYSYRDLRDAIETAKLPDATNYQGARLDQVEPSSIAKQFRATSNASVEALRQALETLREEKKSANLADVHTADFLAALLTGNKKCTSAPNASPADCHEWARGAIVRYFAGWPGTLDRDSNIIRKIKNGTYSSANLRAENSEAWELSLRSLLFSTSREVSAPRFATLALSTEACLPSAPTEGLCQLVTRVGQSILDDSAVRNARVQVNFIHGWERLLVLVVAFAATGLLVLRYFARRSAATFADTIRATLEPSSPGHVESGATVTEQNITEQNTRQLGAALKAIGESDHNIRTAPLRAMIDAASSDLQFSTNRHDLTRTTAAILEKLAHERLLPDYIVGLLPVIGLVATLRGLIEAISKAPRIATTTGDLRGAEIDGVTSVLSACFSTTMIALVALAILALWSGMQARRERAIIHDVQASLEGLLFRHFAEKAEDERRAAASQRVQDQRAAAAEASRQSRLLERRQEFLRARAQANKAEARVKETEAATDIQLAEEIEVERKALFQAASTNLLEDKTTQNPPLEQPQ